MPLRTLTLTLAAAVFSTAAVAQPAATPSGAGTNKQKSDSQSAASMSSYGREDCQKDMANAEEAKRAGHITDKEHAEQKKMAETKLKRDSGQVKGGDGDTCR